MNAPEAPASVAIPIGSELGKRISRTSDAILDFLKSRTAEENSLSVMGAALMSILADMGHHAGSTREAFLSFAGDAWDANPHADACCECSERKGAAR